MMSNTSYLQAVQVNFDPSTNLLSVFPEQVTVRPGDTITWQFFGMPQGWNPWVHFKPHDGSEITGTFSRSLAGVWWTVPEDGFETLEYRASIRFRAGKQNEAYALYASSLAKISIVEEQPTEKKITVKKKELGTSDLEVDPKYLRIYKGDIVTWEFDKDIFPNKYFLARIRFDKCELGPFTTFSYSENDLGNRIVTASGYAYQPAKSYSYQAFAIHEATGEMSWESSPDPVIDDQGEPPPP